MLEGLRKELQRVEVRLRTLVSDMNGRITTVEGDVRAIDEPVQHAFDRVDGSLGRVQALLQSKAESTKKQIGRLAPPT